MDIAPESTHSSGHAGVFHDPEEHFHLLARHQGIWWPYRSMYRALVQMEANRAAVLAIHRKMAEEAAVILELEQDIVLELSAKAREYATGNRLGKAAKIDAVFDNAIASARKLGERVIDVQIRALEAMRTNAKIKDNESPAMPAGRSREARRLEGGRRGDVDGAASPQ